MDSSFKDGLARLQATRVRDGDRRIIAEARRHVYAFAWPFAKREPDRCLPPSKASPASTRSCAVVSDEFVPVAEVRDIAPGTGSAVVVGDREIALFNVAGTFYAIDNTCPHQGGPLAEGWIEGNVVTCPWHAWTFRMKDGTMTLGDFARVDAFDVRVENDVVAVCRTPRPES